MDRLFFGNETEPSPRTQPQVPLEQKLRGYFSRVFSGDLLPDEVNLLASKVIEIVVEHREDAEELACNKYHEESAAMIGRMTRSETR